MHPRAGGETGRRTTLKMWRPCGHRSSILLLPTILTRESKTMRLKRWESPRREGRNDKGKGGSARKRQLKKQRQMLRQRLKDANKPDNSKNNKHGEENIFFPYFFSFSYRKKVSKLTPFPAEGYLNLSSSDLCVLCASAVN